MQEREKVKLQTHVPMLLRLDSIVATESNSPYSGLKWRYSVTTADSRPAFPYVPRTGHDAIVRSGASDGDEIEILKYKRGQATYFELKRLSDAQEPRPVLQESRVRGYYSNGSAANGNHSSAHTAQPNGVCAANVTVRLSLNRRLVHSVGVAHVLHNLGRGSSSCRECPYLRPSAPR